MCTAVQVYILHVYMCTFYRCTGVHSSYVHAYILHMYMCTFYICMYRCTFYICKSVHSTYVLVYILHMLRCTFYICKGVHSTAVQVYRRIIYKCTGLGAVNQDLSHVNLLDTDFVNQGDFVFQSISLIYFHFHVMLQFNRDLVYDVTKTIINWGTKYHLTTQDLQDSRGKSKGTANTRR